MSFCQNGAHFLICMNSQNPLVVFNEQSEMYVRLLAHHIYCLIRV